MRIGVNCFNLQANMGGLRQYFLRLFRELLEQDVLHTYVFFHGKHNIPELEPLGTDRWRDSAVLIDSQEDILPRLAEVDLYFCPFGVLWPRPVPVPSVVTLVDIQEVFFPQFFTEQDLWNRAYHYQGSTRSATEVITISQYSKKTIVEHHRVSADKVRVVYLAADDYFYGYDSEEVSLDLPPRYIFYPANRWLHKNHDNLLKALVILRDDFHVRIDCVLTGFDYDAGYPLKAKAQEYGLSEQIRVIGYVGKKEIKQIYRQAVMLCFPSLFEGFGMPLVEAMAIGCPVVCSNTTSIPEIVGDAALFFDPHNPRDIAEKIRALWDNPSLRAMLVEAGRKQADKYSVKKLAAGHLEAFNRAENSFSMSRYRLNRFILEPMHRINMRRKRYFLQVAGR
ncbi:MAG: glycosyltransferase family 1 protein [Nitrospiraceae bacterium]|nr:glycosyltransferase family 1 protein [Nitrospiraceae bacterium]